MRQVIGLVFTFWSWKPSIGEGSRFRSDHREYASRAGRGFPHFYSIPQRPLSLGLRDNAGSGDREEMPPSEVSAFPLRKRSPLSLPACRLRGHPVSEPGCGGDREMPGCSISRGTRPQAPTLRCPPSGAHPQAPALHAHPGNTHLTV